MAIWVVWQRMSIISGYRSEIPWVRKRMGYLFCFWRTLRKTHEKMSAAAGEHLLFFFSWTLKRIRIFKHFHMTDAFEITITQKLLCFWILCSFYRLIKSGHTSSSIQLCLHAADVRVEAGEDNASFPAFLQNTGQDDIEEGIHVEVGW